MNSNEDIQKYINEMMQLYKKSENAQSNAVQDSAQTPKISENIQENTEAESKSILPIEYEVPISDEEESEPVPLFENSYSDTGFLQVNVTTGEKTIPLENAVVVITTKTPIGQTAVSITPTDANGKTPIITLPAPDSNATGDANTPFATYSAEIFLKGYHTVINENVPIFSGTTSILPVNMVPLPTNAKISRDIIFYSDEPKF